jgi:hypothetical protein
MPYGGSEDKLTLKTIAKMKNLNELQLTQNDFQLLNDGLEMLPEKGLTGEMFSDLLGAMMLKDNEEAKQKHETEMEFRRKKREREAEIMKEEIRILQGKLLQFKRYLKENELLSEANNILEK